MQSKLIANNIPMEIVEIVEILARNGMVYRANLCLKMSQLKFCRCSTNKLIFM